jgi:hypothetical protein
MVRFRLHEPAVALTDLLIGVEAGVFALILARAGSADATRTQPAVAIRRWFVVLFGATSVAALAGAALHGFFPDRGAVGRLRLWRISLGSIGISALSAWGLAAVLALPTHAANRLQGAAAAAHAAYLVALTRANPPYMVAIAVYLPGAAALGLALLTRVWHPALRQPAATGLAGLGLTFGAAVVQLRRMALHPRLFDHNATYHAIQAIAMACFYVAARGFIRASRQPGGRR